ncbi:MAG: phenylalanine--tRNA ligase subunit beta, partial [Simkaniaceae bacterium]|nr:phenylalanine--tRNA ligase subunit beta [Simkaniaceae bacterium]
MLVSLTWLKEFISFKQSPEEIAALLIDAGLEVDKIERTKLSFSGIVCGKVLNVTPHKDADKLNIAEVTDGSDTYQVVCGASNCQAGIKVAFAKIGACLELKDNKKIKIKKGKLKGIESFGMLCSEEELGLADTSDGIMHLPPDTTLGLDLQELYSDILFEISLTPNLGHCMSILGVARELAAKLECDIKRPTFSLVEDSKNSIEEKISVTIKDTENCNRYCCRILEGVTVAPSPPWLINRLTNAGVRSINNIVDVTNYVMLELGQPLHAFDYDQIEGSKIIIDSSTKETSIVTLDGEERAVPKGTLLLSDAKSPIAIAGIMGSKRASTEDYTQNVLIESAYFSAQSVRKGSKKLSLRSESSSRFEKGVDYHGVQEALDLAVFLMQKVAGGKIVKNKIDQKPTPFEERTLTIRTKKTNQILGTFFTLQEIEYHLNNLNFKSLKKNNDCLTVSIPSYRNDVEAEIDLIEDVARIYGYNNIPKSNPKYSSSKLPSSPIYLLEREVRKRCTSFGLQEFLTCDLISPKLSKIGLETSLASFAQIEVMHPSSIDQSILRSSLLPGLLASIKINQDHKQTDINAFEIGKIHFKNNENFTERMALAIVQCGTTQPYHFQAKEKSADFYGLKGIIENLLHTLNIETFSFKKSSLSSFHPNKQTAIYSGETLIGSMGEIHPEQLLMLDIKKSVFFAQIDLQDLLALKKRSTQMTPLAQFPESDRDWTVSLKK